MGLMGNGVNDVKVDVYYNSRREFPPAIEYN